ncbi:MAG: hypothetical protein ACI85O_001779 [Saprospiraceae bacterium]|jgi:hypothetical protein
MNSKNYLYVLLLCLMPMLANAQGHEQCKTSEVRQQNFLVNPELIQQRVDTEAQMQKWIAEEYPTYVAQKDLVTLPVVVHVLWRTQEQNISEAQILSQVEVLNEDFQKMNANSGDTPAAFQGIAADVEIEFCQASVDPAGNPTNGITRRQITQEYIGDTEDWYSTSAGGQDPWDNSKYINVWVCEIDDQGTLGFATPPGTAVPASADGMVIAPQFYGKTGTAIQSFPNHLGRTVTHEMGHYLNLEHVWGPTNGGCGEDDFVADTPSQFEENYECPNFPLTDDCTTGGNGIQFMNFLDYVDDNCMTMFSEGQKARMLAAVNGPRASLLTSTACGMTINTNDITLVPTIIYPNPTANFVIMDTPIAMGQESVLTIFDVSGKIVLTQKYNSTPETVKVNVQDLNAGIHLVELRFGDNVQGGKLLIEK